MRFSLTIGNLSLLSVCKKLEFSESNEPRYEQKTVSIANVIAL